MANENINLVDSFSEFKDLKSIDRETMMRILEEVFKSTLLKKYGTDDNIDIIVNIDKGDLEIWRNLTIVDDAEFTDSTLQISYSDAIKIEPDFEVGEDVSQPIFLKDFGRREILNIRQTLIAKIQEYENNLVYKQYKERIGDVITGEVYQIWKKETLLLDDNGIELVLPKSEQISADFYRKGDTLRAVVLKVDVRNNVPVVVLSRTSPVFLERLLEQEVPEIFDGLITIKKIVREPGERAKVVVESYDDRIDPVGACVGMKGSRIHGIVRELRNENIDVINWTTNPELLITRALSPAKVSSITINEADKRAEVFMKADQVSLAIGKGGSNIKLAGRLSDYEIDVYREADEVEDDVDLQEFRDEIDQWVLDQLKNIGCDTAKSVLNLGAEELAKRTDLEEETIQEVINVLHSEFEE